MSGGSSVPFLLLLGVLGLVFGSFANVVIWRFPRGESLSTPPSHCPKCDHAIRWYDNVPVVSWLLLRGRCRDCGEPIPARYPSVELGSGALWVLAGVLYGFSARTTTAIVLFYLLLILALIDLDTMRLPNALVGILAVAGLAAVLAAQFTGFDAAPLTWVGGSPPDSPILMAAFGVALGAGLSLAVAALYSGLRKTSGFGMGDVKLLGALGFYFGPFVLMVLFFGSLIGAAVGLTLVRGRGALRTKKIPFGPMLALGAIVTAVAGPSLWAWYAGVAHLV